MITLLYLVRKKINDKNDVRKLGDWVAEGVFLLIIELVFVPAAHYGTMQALSACGLTTGVGH